MRRGRRPRVSLWLADSLGAGNSTTWRKFGKCGALVRNGHGLDEVLLKTRLDCGLHLFNAPDQILNTNARGAIQQRNSCPGSGRIARRTHLLKIAIGNHAENHRVLDIDVAAERARETNAIHVIDAEPLHEQARRRRTVPPSPVESRAHRSG